MVPDAQPIRENSTAVPADQLGRLLRSLRVSVTDRCDFRCVYCMADDMEFLPKQEVLSLEDAVKALATEATPPDLR